VTSLPDRIASISNPPEILNSKLSPSTSLADKLVAPDPSSSKDTSDIAANTGASLTADTLSVTVALSLSSPSDTLKLKLSSPLKFVSGVYVANEPSSVTLPFEASVSSENVRLSPSISLPDKVTTTL